MRGLNREAEKERKEKEVRGISLLHVTVVIFLSSYLFFSRKPARQTSRSPGHCSAERIVTGSMNLCERRVLARSGMGTRAGMSIRYTLHVLTHRYTVHGHTSCGPHMRDGESWLAHQTLLCTHAPPPLCRHGGVEIGGGPGEGGGVSVPSAPSPSLRPHALQWQHEGPNVLDEGGYTWLFAPSDFDGIHYTLSASKVGVGSRLHNCRGHTSSS